MAAAKGKGKDVALGLGGQLDAQLQGAADEPEDDDAKELRLAHEHFEATQRKIQERKAAKAKEEQRLLEEAAAAAARLAAGGGSAETSGEPDKKSIKSVLVLKLPEVDHEFHAVDVGMVIVDKLPEYHVTSRLLAYKKAGTEIEVLVLEVGRFFSVFDVKDKL